MLDIRLIREQPEFVKTRLATRGGDDAAKVDRLLQVDSERRKAETSLQQLNAERKRLSKEIGGKRSRGESSEELEAQVRGIGDRIALLNEQAASGEEEQKRLLLQIPNLPHPAAPIGKEAADNPVIRNWGEKPRIEGEVLGSCRDRHERLGCSIWSARQS